VQFACLNFGNEYQWNVIIECYKLSSLEERDEGIVVSEGILEAIVLH
jgi:hypothetical protein